MERLEFFTKEPQPVPKMWCGSTKQKLKMFLWLESVTVTDAQMDKDSSFSLPDSQGSSQSCVM